MGSFVSRINQSGAVGIEHFAVWDLPRVIAAYDRATELLKHDAAARAASLHRARQLVQLRRLRRRQRRQARRAHGQDTKAPKPGHAQAVAETDAAVAEVTQEVVSAAPVPPLASTFGLGGSQSDEAASAAAATAAMELDPNQPLRLSRRTFREVFTDVSVTTPQGRFLTLPLKVFDMFTKPLSGDVDDNDDSSDDDGASSDSESHSDGEAAASTAASTCSSKSSRSSRSSGSGSDSAASNASAGAGAGAGAGAAAGTNKGDVSRDEAQPQHKASQHHGQAARRRGAASVVAKRRPKASISRQRKRMATQQQGSATCEAWVDAREVFALLALLSVGTHQDQLQFAFNLFDADGSGSISKDEVELLLVTLSRAACRVRIVSSPLRDDEVSALVGTIFRRLVHKAHKFRQGDDSEDQGAEAKSKALMKRLLTGPKRPTPGKRRGKLPPWHKARDQGAIRVGPNGRTRRGRRVTVTSGGRLVEVTDVGTALRVSARVKQAAAKMAALSAKFKQKHSKDATEVEEEEEEEEVSMREFIAWTRSDVGVQTFLYRFTRCRMAVPMEASTLTTIGRGDGGMQRGGTAAATLLQRIAERRQRRATTQRLQANMSTLLGDTKFGVKELHKLMSEFAVHAKVRQPSNSSSSSTAESSGDGSDDGDTAELDKEGFIAAMQTVFPLFAQAAGGLAATTEGADLSRLFDAFDDDNSGYIDFREFTMGMSKLAHGTVLDKISLLFACYDADGNGRISHQEMLQFVARSNDDVVTNLSFARDIVRSLDSDGDGHVTLDEFQKALTREPALLHCLARNVLPQLAFTKKVARDIQSMSKHLNLTMLRRVWERIHADGDDSKRGLSRTEFRRFMGEEFGCSSDAMPLVNKVFDAFDRDGDGSVSFQEMMDGLGQVLTGSIEERSQFYFNLYDEDRSGVMEKHEIMSLMEQGVAAADTGIDSVTALLSKLQGKPKAPQQQQQRTAAAAAAAQAGDADEATVSLRQFRDAAEADPAVLESFGKLFGAGGGSTTEVTTTEQEAQAQLKRAVTTLLKIQGRVLPVVRAARQDVEARAVKQRAQNGGGGSGDSDSSSSDNSSSDDEGDGDGAGKGGKDGEQGTGEGGGGNAWNPDPQDSSMLLAKRTTATQVQLGLSRLITMDVSTSAELVVQLQRAEHVARARVARHAAAAVRAHDKLRRAVAAAALSRHMKALRGGDHNLHKGAAVASIASAAVAAARSHSAGKATAPVKPQQQAGDVAAGESDAGVGGAHPPISKAIIAAKYLPAVASMAARLHGVAVGKRIAEDVASLRGTGVHEAARLVSRVLSVPPRPRGVGAAVMAPARMPSPAQHTSPAPAHRRDSIVSTGGASDASNGSDDGYGSLRLDVGPGTAVAAAALARAEKLAGRVGDESAQQLRAGPLTVALNAPSPRRRRRRKPYIPMAPRPAVEPAMPARDRPHMKALVEVLKHDNSQQSLLAVHPPSPSHTPRRSKLRPKPSQQWRRVSALQVESAHSPPLSPAAVVRARAALAPAAQAVPWDHQQQQQQQQQQAGPESSPAASPEVNTSEGVSATPRSHKLVRAVSWRGPKPSAPTTARSHRNLRIAASTVRRIDSSKPLPLAYEGSHAKVVTARSASEAAGEEVMGVRAKLQVAGTDGRLDLLYTPRGGTAIPIADNSPLWDMELRPIEAARLRATRSPPLPELDPLDAGMLPHPADAMAASAPITAASAPRRLAHQQLAAEAAQEAAEEEDAWWLQHWYDQYVAVHKVAPSPGPTPEVLSDMDELGSPGGGGGVTPYGSRSTPKRATPREFAHLAMRTASFRAEQATLRRHSQVLKKSTSPRLFKSVHNLASTPTRRGSPHGGLIKPVVQTAGNRTAAAVAMTWLHRSKHEAATAAAAAAAAAASASTSPSKARTASPSMVAAAASVQRAMRSMGRSTPTPRGGVAAEAAAGKRKPGVAARRNGASTSKLLRTGSGASGFVGVGTSTRTLLRRISEKQDAMRSGEGGGASPVNNNNRPSRSPDSVGGGRRSRNARASSAAAKAAAKRPASIPEHVWNLVEA